jgi:hypothetical protein
MGAGSRDLIEPFFPEPHAESVSQAAKRGTLPRNQAR